MTPDGDEAMRVRRTTAPPVADERVTSNRLPGAPASAASIAKITIETPGASVTSAPWEARVGGASGTTAVFSTLTAVGTGATRGSRARRAHCHVAPTAATAKAAAATCQMRNDSI